MKAKASKFFGAGRARKLNLPTFFVTSKPDAKAPQPGQQVAVNVDTLERVASESANRHRSLS